VVFFKIPRSIACLPNTYTETYFFILFIAFAAAGWLRPSTAAR
jgi:hypothetical protein